MKNNRRMCFDFYYGKEAEQFNFYRIPKLLFTDIKFSKVSIEAKVLYGLLMDRMSLSIKNNWVDEENRVYIYFKVSDAMEYMNICKEKAIKLFAELDCEKGCGLILRKRQGLGKPAVIYVMNFNSETTEESQNDDVELYNFQRLENQTSGGVETEDFKKSEMPTSGSMNTPTSRGVKDIPIEVGDANPNYNNINYNKYNNTYLSNTYPIISCQQENDNVDSDVIDVMEERKINKKTICLNIDYEILAQNYGIEILDGIVEIMVDAICSKRDSLTISCDVIPQAVVKERLLKLNSSHIEYVLDCLKKNRTKVHNIKSYLLTALYNSYSTIGHFYTAEVNYDMQV